MALLSAFDDPRPTVPSGLTVELDDYPELFETAFGSRIVRRMEMRTLLHIFGQLEARLSHSDRVILGGLIEGIWPPDRAAIRG